jgi:hypothetical protein
MLCGGLSNLWADGRWLSGRCRDRVEMTLGCGVDLTWPFAHEGGETPGPLDDTLSAGEVHSPTRCVLQSLGPGEADALLLGVLHQSIGARDIGGAILHWDMLERL